MSALKLKLATLAFGLLLPFSALGQATESGTDDGEPRLKEKEEEVVVLDRAEDLSGISTSASEGYVGSKEIELRPILRPGEILEVVPGLIATQHSGTGKANQYFLRGFNLDHGTDFATSVEGMPVNMPTHGHGQGYTDVAFLIPELIDYVEYKKGPYYADQGDFSSAGSANLFYKRFLETNFVSLTGGKDEYERAVVAGTSELFGNKLTVAVEALHYDGPWYNEENGQKANGILRYTSGSEENGWSIIGMGYYGDWDSTDQIPKRAVDSGLIDRLDTIDPTDGGRSSRASLSGDWRQSDGESFTRANLYAIYYRLNLWSNFTYFLDDPENGDQFEQVDRRTIFGGELSHEWPLMVGSLPFTNKIGIETRNDLIPTVALHKTRARERLSTVRQDDVQESNIGIYGQTEIELHEKVRAEVGVRGDIFFFDVESASGLSENGGSEDDGIVSPKAGLVFGPWHKTELFLNGGLGFHSNDARGTTISVDPSDPSVPLDKVDPLVRSEGAEVGVRSTFLDGLNSTLSLWLLRLDSELLFVGDAGTTDATRPSRRYGIEWANFYRPISWLSLDADLAFSKARFRDDAEEGDEIPGSIESVVAAGISVDHPSGAFGSLRSRYFGPRPLIEDGSKESGSSFLVNAEAGYRWDRYTLSLELLNLFDKEASDIDYFYTSRLPGEPAEGVDDKHFHPAEPFTARATLRVNF